MSVLVSERPFLDLVHKEQSFHGKSLEGKVALITGAARGIGRSMALELANRGALVAINFRSSLGDAEALQEEIQEVGGQGGLFQGDISDTKEARRVVAEVLDCYKHLDILVNNAGVNRDKSLPKMSDDDWMEVINTNLNGTYFCTSAAIPTMISQKYGRIVNIASFVGQAGNFGQANYAASKGGMIAFTKVVALEMAKYNITANVVAPGFTVTDMLSTVPPDVLEQIKTKIPLRRFAKPEEIAKAVAYLVTDGDYITGQQLNINGGVYM
jgi:NAD(P)-dependent dehydrogenase (short-subunit alcohol dehydrogenase family)